MLKKVRSAIAGATAKQLLMLCCVPMFMACSDSDNNDNVNNNDNVDEEVQNQAPLPQLLYVFGDSLSDTGNLGRPATFGNDLPAPFFDNRISNGRVTVEYLADALQTEVLASNYLDTDEEGSNYAIAGANALDEESFVSLDLQIASYLLKNDSQVDPDNVYLFFIGGNDVIDAVDLGESAGRELLDLAALEVRQAVDAIVSRGGTEIVVLNVPNIGSTPKMLGGPEGQAVLAEALTQHFNAAVAANLQGVETNTVRLLSIDMYAALEDIISRGAELGFANTTEACFVTDALRFADICSNEQLDSFVFFDSIHPSAETHRLLGEEVVRQFTAARAM